jgi:cytochrome c
VIRVVAAVWLAATPAFATEGAQVFETHCASCHAAVSGAPPGAGPNLAGLRGRRVGGDPASDYSPTLKAARAAGHVWDAVRLQRFLDDPEAMYPGLWMGGTSLRTAADVSAVVTYLIRLQER